MTMGAEKSTLTQTLRSAFVEMMKSVGTSVPGHVIAFDPATQLAQIQIGIVRLDVNGQTFTPPPIIKCPVHFSGGDWVLEYQVDPKCEGLVIFSQRCIDAWVQTGGVAEQPQVRFHDFNDALFIPGFRSQVGKIADFANDGIRLRNKAGTHYLWIKADGTIERTNGNGTDTMLPDGTVNINGVTISPSGVITLPNGVILNTHGHNQDPDSAGNTQQKTKEPVNQ